MSGYKQIIVYNKNANISFNSCLKYIVRGSLDSVQASIKSSKSKVDNWLRFGQKKVTLQVPSDADLLSLKQVCDNKKITNVLLQTEQNLPWILVPGPGIQSE